MATGIQYFQRVGTLDSVPHETLGKKIVDPRNGRVFRYVKLVDAVKPVKGAPVARVGIGFASAWQVAADYSSINAENFVGINTASTASIGHYFWVMQEGALGTDSQSDVYAGAIYAYTCTGVAKDDNLRWIGDNSVAGGATVTFDILQAQLSLVHSGGTNKAASIGSTATSAIMRATQPNIIGQAFGADSSSAVKDGFIKAPFAG